jgi:hypothetical protein
LIPARYGALRAAASITLLDPTRLDPRRRLAACISHWFRARPRHFFRRTGIPESPRWLVIHGRETEAVKIVDEIETRFRLHDAAFEDGSALKPMLLRPSGEVLLLSKQIAAGDQKFYDSGGFHLY